MVYGQCWLQGSFAEYCIVDGRNVSPMPKLVDPLNAAAIPLVSQTSYQAIIKMKLKKGDKFLILGGSTATGIAAIQIAKKFIECGEVIVTSSQEEFCKSLGADRVINYKEADWTKELKDYGVDAIYDCVGGEESWDKCRTQGVIKKDGHYITIVGDKEHGDTLTFGKIVGTGFSVLNRKFWGSVGHQKYDMMLADSKKNLKDISSLIDANKLKIKLDPQSPFKFEDFMKVFDVSMSRRAKGKLVLFVSDDDEKFVDEKKEEVKQEEEPKQEEEEEKPKQEEEKPKEEQEKPKKEEDQEVEEPKEKEEQEEEPKKDEEEEAPKEDDKDKPSDDKGDDQ